MKFFNNLFDIKDEQVILGLNDELKTIYLYDYYLNKTKSILVVCNTLFEANNMYKSLSNYTDNVLFFPMDDFLTSEALAISPELEITRLETINNLITNNKQIIVTNLMGLLRYLPTKENYEKSIIDLKVNMDYDIKKLESDLYNIGYHSESFVNKTGEYAPRGFVLDIFPLGNIDPIRIEFWGDTIDSIKTFDVDTQLTKSSIDSIKILPITEFITNKDVSSDDRRQKNLIKYEVVSNISGYLDNCTLTYINYDEIEIGYKNLLDDIFNYNTENNLDVNTKYMHNLEEIKSNNILFISF